MGNILKWTGIVVGGLLGLVLIAVGIVYHLSNQHLNARYDITPVALTIPQPDSAMLARGEHLAHVRSCTGCHGANLAGEVMVDNAAFGRISSANITRGKGSVVLHFTDADWVRAIRHGVAPDGRPLLLMPAKEFIQLGREDLVAIIAYVKQVPPVDHLPLPQKIGPIARMLELTNDDFPLINAEKIDHSTPLSDAPEAGITPEYGKYMSGACQGCHGADLATPSPGPPDTPLPANLTLLQDWTQDDFMRAVRTGVKPTGDTLDTFMPRWTSPTDEELLSIWAYIKTLKPKGEQPNR